MNLNGFTQIKTIPTLPLLNSFNVYNNYIQTDQYQSQILLNNSERFGLLLAENIETVGSNRTVESENIGK